MQQKMKYILAIAIAMFAISVAVFYLAAPRPGEIARTPELTQPAPDLSTPVQGEKAAPAQSTPQEPARLDGEKPPLLFVLIAAIMLAVWFIRRLFRKRPLPQPQPEPAVDTQDAYAGSVPPGVIAQLQNIAAEISSWTLDNDRHVLEQLNRDARRIGEALYRQGGKKRMLEAYRQAGSQRVIESAWKGIGTWKG